ncbi:putative Cwf19l2 protein [Paratrimastix pyriformis]|uniref:Cwf19l2 protein n=1 Tax=Paratrimastix pyriformis TaxID=342808 RepID=A0ABQ8UF21_9EUKA|nr:putative Cwf19l2 protein [Paratrimastix pyriformis]
MQQPTTKANSSSASSAPTTPEVSRTSSWRDEWKRVREGGTPSPSPKPALVRSPTPDVIPVTPTRTPATPRTPSNPKMLAPSPPTSQSMRWKRAATATPSPTPSPVPPPQADVAPVPLNTKEAHSPSEGAVGLVAHPDSTSTTPAIITPAVEATPAPSAPAAAAAKPKPGPTANQLQAQLLRCQLMGDTEGEARIKAQLAALPPAPVQMVNTAPAVKPAPPRGGDDAGDEVTQAAEQQPPANVVVLSGVDMAGRPLAGVGARLAKDEQDMTASELAIQERMTSKHTLGAELRAQKRALVPGMRGGGDAFDTAGAEYGQWGESEAVAAPRQMPPRAGRKHGREAPVHDERNAQITAKGLINRDVHDERNAQITETNRIETLRDRCPQCQAPIRGDRHMIAVGNFVYLCMPAHGCLVPGHCMIVPSDHFNSTLQADDNTWTEITNFKKCLIRMFDRDDQDVLFVETAMYFDKLPHTFIDVIPLPREVGAMASGYFMKAINEAESEFKRQNTKQIKTIPGKGAKGKIPPKLPYFCVEFGATGGYAYAIEDERIFRNFARMWAPFDWTKMLLGETPSGLAAAGTPSPPPREAQPSSSSAEGDSEDPGMAIAEGPDLPPDMMMPATAAVAGDDTKSEKPKQQQAGRAASLTADELRRLF